MDFLAFFAFPLWSFNFVTYRTVHDDTFLDTLGSGLKLCEVLFFTTLQGC